ncbi:MAG: four helix bundle protein [Planctomycetes bacterium]|nr:four helix bundle protein [Planctomycetota bacterium]
MFERFTDRARKVMALANQEAQRYNHEYIGTEHILLGLVKEGSGVGATVLKTMGVDIKKLRLEVEKRVKSGPNMVTMGKLPQTPRAKQVIIYAIEEARALGHNYVGTEHLLLGLLRETEGIAAQMLMNLGLKLEDVRQEVLNLLGAGSGQNSGVPLAGMGPDMPWIEMPVRLGDRALGVMVSARREAQQSQQEHIRTEHVLLSLVEDSNGLAVVALRSLGVDTQKLRPAVEKLVPSAPATAPPGGPAPSHPVKEAIWRAAEDAYGQDCPFVDTGHLLIGLIQDPQSTAAQALTSLGPQLDTVRAKVLELRAGGCNDEPRPRYSVETRLAQSGVRQPAKRGRGRSLFGRFWSRAGKWIGTGGDDPMYERFTDRARKVMALANQEARRFNHEYIGTEHILLGLVLEGSATGATVMKNLGVDLAALRAEVEKLVQSGSEMVTAGKLPQTPRAKHVIEYAIEEARALNHNYVGTEHILLGLLRERDGIAAQVLMNLGLQLTDVRQEVLNLLGAGIQDTARPPEAVESREASTIEDESSEELPRVTSYKDLPVWREADELARQIYAVTATFPPVPIPTVTSRLRELALSIPPHIAEAHSRPIPAEARWFLNAAFGSLRELRYLLDFAKRLEFLKPEDHQRLDNLAEKVDHLLRSFYAAPGP